MGCRELIESLRRAGDEKIETIRREADAEAEKVRAEALQRIEQMRSEFSAQSSAQARERTASVISDAERGAKLRRLETGRTLSERLFSLAAPALRGLRDRRCGDVFKALSDELPPLSWRTIRVNPEDAGIARERFPKAEVVTDPDISGGLDATDESGKIRVINTFEKRLERAWKDLLPGLIEDVYREAGNREFAAKT